MFCSEGVGAVRRIVGTWDLVAGVVNGDDERTRTVSVVVRDNNDNGMSWNNKSRYVQENG